MFLALRFSLCSEFHNTPSVSINVCFTYVMLTPGKINLEQNRNSRLDLSVDSSLEVASSCASCLQAFFLNESINSP